VFLEGVYRRIERWIEGPREARLRLEAAPWTGGKIARKAAKQALFLLVSLALAHVFLSFFVSMRDLWSMMRHDPREHWGAFVWVMGITGAVYFDFAWFREQLCIVICPYGRLQSVLTDDHSMVIGYDGGRGEPRGRLTREQREGSAIRSEGDCVDCGRCVAVCPTGIDIRNGLQLECIGCAQCIDACDEVMDRVARPRGLIRYDSLEGLAGRAAGVLRPRLVAYGLLMVAACTALAVALLGRSPFEANLLRVRGSPFVLDGDSVRNQFELHLVNKNPGSSTLTVVPAERDGTSFLVPQKEITLGSLQSFRLPVFVTLPRSAFHGPFEVELEVRDGASGQRREVEARFLGPM
jgi:cytochrome c oxidase accessory protein FixG